MAFEITRPGKNSLIVDTPVMTAAGTFGFGDVYRGIVKYDKLGAIVTNPVTLEPWSPATGTRVIPLDAGTLIHTGLPNPGLSRVLKQYRQKWQKIPAPIILHLVGTRADQIQTAMTWLDEEETVSAIELGLSDDMPAQRAKQLIQAAVDNIEKPVLARLPMYEATSLAEAAVDAGADAIVVAAPPRGTARDPMTGRLVSGRIYGPLVKPMILRLVGVLTRRFPSMPIIGAGGIHSPADARDYLEAGAVAVQVDSVTWVQPNMLEQIARDLGGWLVTRHADAFPDEWYPGLGDTEQEKMEADRPSEPADDAS